MRSKDGAWALRNSVLYDRFKILLSNNTFIRIESVCDIFLRHPPLKIPKDRDTHLLPNLRYMQYQIHKLLQHNSSYTVVMQREKGIHLLRSHSSSRWYIYLNSVFELSFSLVEFQTRRMKETNKEFLTLKIYRKKKDVLKHYVFCQGVMECYLMLSWTVCILP